MTEIHIDASMAPNGATGDHELPGYVNPYTTKDEVETAQEKTSGDDKNAGDWTTTGNGTAYPNSGQGAHRFAKTPIQKETT